MFVPIDFNWIETIPVVLDTLRELKEIFDD